ncbi:hypothetical protein [Fundidesulfovibrio agrisoli]|uniref:hypothetical protein n=1 Tax=Fundidesulfovibrio agrisoli TaxID=2922717 RepID=UPI001FAC20FF|nr:hypothetical protein [Fundidesulfovibrio agrisoli]
MNTTRTIAIGVVLATCLLLPGSAMSQSLQKAAACKRTYVQCVNSKEITDEAGKYQCVKQYQACYKANYGKEATVMPSGTPTVNKSVKQP